MSDSADLHHNTETLEKNFTYQEINYRLRLRFECRRSEIGGVRRICCMISS